MRRLLPAAVVLALSLHVSGCVCLIEAEEEVDYPTFLNATAGCAPDDWWDLWAEVSHPDGPRGVTEVTVDISYVFYDTLDDSMILEYLGGYYLDYQADGQWAAAVESGTDILDCYYEGEYHFLFGAADQEGETAAFEVFN